MTIFPFFVFVCVVLQEMEEKVLRRHSHIVNHIFCWTCIWSLY